MSTEVKENGDNGQRVCMPKKVESSAAKGFVGFLKIKEVNVLDLRAPPSLCAQKRLQLRHCGGWPNSGDGPISVAEPG